MDQPIPPVSYLVGMVTDAYLLDSGGSYSGFRLSISTLQWTSLLYVHFSFFSIGTTPKIS